MKDNKDKQKQESEDEVHAPLAGKRLADARREQQIGVLEIAKEMHLDEYKVRALENNDFDVIGAPVFAKGHLKKYAQLLKVDDATVMGEYYELTRAQGGQPPLSVQPKQRQSIVPIPWLAVIAVAIVVVTAYWWLAVPEPIADEVVVGQVAPMAEELAAAEIEEEVAAELKPAVDELEPETELVVEPVEELSEMRLSITYSGDSWTDISDAQGRRLFFDLGKTGGTVNLSGEAPLNVLFGDAANVSLLRNGAAFDLPPADRRGTVRFTILSP